MSASPQSTAPVSTVGPPLKTSFKRARPALVIASVVVATALVLAWAGAGGNRGALDPDAYSQNGSRAAAALLEARGVDVIRVTSTLDAIEALGTDPGRSTLVVTNPLLVDAERAQTLSSSGAASIVVLNAEESPLLSTLAPNVAVTTPARTQSREPDCTWQPAVLAGSARTGGGAFVVNGESSDVERCYPSDQGATVLHIAADGRDVTLVGDAQAFTNARLDAEGNAALAVNVLGQRERVVWYLPSFAELGVNEPQSLEELLPAWVGWAAVQCFVVVFALALWRGRRFGPVVVEELPVVVPAAEVVEGRARLYRKAKARDRAAARIRDASLRRIRTVTGSPRVMPTTAVVTLVTERTGRDGTDVAELLYGAAPANDAALVRLLDELDLLEREVRES